MNHIELRKKFLKFFEKRGHKIIPSSSLTPGAEDYSLLFTTAGMQQFKAYYLGEKDPMADFNSQRVVSIQKSFRTSDIEEVGDETHNTFFEMLGNFSFGRIGNDDPRDFGNKGYFKKAALAWTYEFLTKELNLPISYATVFKGEDGIKKDTDSFKILENLGIKTIKERGKEDNFWGPTGKKGPCGPTVEYYIGETEIWNIVFNEYFCDLESNEIEKLQNPGVDTGMGLERLLMVLQNKKSVYETDIFLPLIKIISDNSEAQNIKFSRIIADHTRAVVFIASEGIAPSNLGRGYVLRRLIRRILRYGKFIGFPEKNYPELINKVIETYQEPYPELRQNLSKIHKIIEEEILTFSRALAKGLKEFEKLTKDNSLSAKEAFYLYETYGFPFELTKELAQEKNIKIEEEEFKKELARHQEISRAGAEKKFGGHNIKTKNQISGSKNIVKLHTATHLLQSALREILGTQVRQMGSDINEERTRFDFSFERKLSEEEIKKIENRVNEIIQKDLPVEKQEMSYEEAVKQGALAFFKEKYPEKVNVYKIGDFSKEICGGPHVQSTKEIKGFKIIKEEGIGKGIRRIKAIIIK